MMTMKTSTHAGTHALHRDGDRALCRRNLKPGTFEGGSNAGRPMVFNVTAKSSHLVQVDCTGCLDKLRAERAAAFDAAHAEQADRNAGPRTVAAKAAVDALAKATPAQRDALTGSYKISGVRVLDGRVRVGTVLALRDRLGLVSSTTQRFEFDTRRYARLSDAGIMAVAILAYGADTVLAYAAEQDAAARVELEARHQAERDTLEAQHAAEQAELDTTPSRGVKLAAQQDQPRRDATVKTTKTATSRATWKPARVRRAQLRELRRDNRAKGRAVKAVATGQPQTMGTHLLALGVGRKLAKSYAGTVSKNVPVHADSVTVSRKLKGRRRGTFSAYTYTRRQVARALATYVTKGGPRRPADRAAFTAAAVNA